METTAPTSGHSLALLTDLYQLTMAYGYWKEGLAERRAAFHVSFRSHPFRGGFTVAAGLGPALDYLTGFRFAPDDLEYLAGLRGQDDRALFAPDFLAYLKGLRLRVDVDAVPEGTIVFPHEPLLRIEGPLLEAQLLETALLTQLNFQSLIATKAARIALAAQQQPVIEFGLRRAQGFDGGLSASRAAFIGGCAATSNALAGKLFGIPVKGTHAHSWVMCFESELEAFEAYAHAQPNNCIFLVDTYDTLAGVRHAVQVGQRLRAQGHELVGIRLDSGDLAWLSIEARKLLDAGGFPKAQIVASNDLDEHIIASLKSQNAAIDVWGVGTRLVTAYDQPALGGVYKLAAIQDDGGPWRYRLKLSEQTIKISTPGILAARRFVHNGEFIGDVIYDRELGVGTPRTLVDPADPLRRKTIPAAAESCELLVPVLREGQPVYAPPPLVESRARAQSQLAGFHAGVKRFVNPHGYPVGLDLALHERRSALIMQARGFAR